MSTLAQDPAARRLLVLAFGAAAVLVLTTVWAAVGEAPEHWARARFLVLPMAVCAVAAAACALGAWRRRSSPAAAVPLMGGALTALAAIYASGAGLL